MIKPDVALLNAFVEVATSRSFRKAADILELSPSTVSHLISRLEQQLGMRLLHRTTRSVAPTHAGETLLRRLQPALAELYRAMGEIDELREQPTGCLRLNVPEQGASFLLQEIVPVFREKYPDVELDFVTEGRIIDIISEGCDAGIRLGGSIPGDMIGIPLNLQAHSVVVASPGYLSQYKQPVVPEDLKSHQCIRIRLPNGKLYWWEFENDGQALNINVPGSLILNQESLMIDAALAGLGIAYVFRSSVRNELANGRLLSVLDSWCPPGPRAFLYFSSNYKVSPALRAFIDTVKYPGNE